MFESFSFGSYSIFLYFIFYLSVGMTCFYSIRLFYYCFIKQMSICCYMSFYDYFSFMSVSIFFLSLVSIFWLFYSLIFWFKSFFSLFSFIDKINNFSFHFFCFFLGYEFCFISIYFFNMIIYYNFGLLINMSSYLWFFIIILIFLFNLNYSLLCWGDYYGFTGLKHLIFNLNYFIYFFSKNKFNLYLFFLSL